jgi:hypothetical protein
VPTDLDILIGPRPPLPRRHHEGSIAIAYGSISGDASA